jgi:hypothetical protein
MKILSIVNPLSNDYHCLAQFRTDLSKRQKIAAIAAAIFASILPVFGTTAAFRKVVTIFQARNKAQKDQWKAKNFINFPDPRFERNLPIDLDEYTLFKKLNKLGITPENLPFERIWFKFYNSSNANQMFRLESAAYNSEQADLFDSIDPQKNLILFVARDEKEASQGLAGARRSTTFYCLTVGQAFKDDPLPAKFLRLLGK